MQILLRIAYPERAASIPDDSQILCYEGKFGTRNEVLKYIIEHELTDIMVERRSGAKDGITVYVVGNDLTVYIMLDTELLPDHNRCIGKFYVIS